MIVPSGKLPTGHWGRRSMQGCLSEQPLGNLKRLPRVSAVLHVTAAPMDVRGGPRSARRIRQAQTAFCTLAQDEQRL
jgi:hypothetical protein